MTELWRRLSYLARRGRRDEELAEELELHRAMARRELESRGISTGAAAAAAQRALGNDLSARERARDVWVWPWVQDITHDVRFAVRLLLKERWFTAAAVVALALGIGANTAVFTLVNAITWRGLPVDEPHRIVTVYAFDQGGRQLGVSHQELKDWQGATRTFDGLAGLSRATVNLGDADRAPDRVAASHVSWNAFRLLGERPILGRDFIEEDDRPGAPAVIILGHHVWRDRYGSDPGVVGRPITVNGRPAFVIGIMPDGFQFPAMADVWQPLALTAGAASPRRDARSIRVFGRLATGAAMAEGAAEVDGIASRLAVDYPDTNAGVRAGVEPFTGRAREPFLLAMYGAVAFVLLVACANVASLLIARAAHRAREIALRGALGASRWRVIRQLLVESLLMAILAAGLGLLFAKGAMLLFVGDMDARAIAYWVHWGMDGRVLVFLTAAAVSTFVLFGVAPAVYLSRGVSSDGLKEGGRTSTTGARGRTTGVLLVAECALTLVLLAGATLMTRSLLAMQARDLVIDTSRLLTAGVTPPAEKYPSSEQRAEFLRRLEARVRAIPVLASATLTSNLPFISASSRRLSIEGQDEQPVSRQPVALVVTIGDRYFETLGLPLMSGRSFTAIDGTPGHASVIVNRAFAARFFPNQDPIGRRIRLVNASTPNETAAWTTIVGVSPTVRQQPQAQTIEAVAYLPLQATLQAALPANMMLIVRTDVEPAALVGTLREELRELDPDLAVSRILPLDHYVRQSQWTHRLFSRVFSMFAGVALLLSAVGLYAVTTYAVSQRTQEIGVRMALGAQRAQVVWLFVQRMVLQLSVGLAVGLAGAFGLGTLLSGLLVQTSSTDPVTLAIAVLCLVGAAALATLIPVRRAMQLDPVSALRHE
jgi:putative ABC transport system permease protein